MILLLNFARLAMVLWIVYGLLLVFAPSVVQSPPKPASGALQAIIAFAIGYLLAHYRSSCAAKRKAPLAMRYRSRPARVTLGALRRLYDL